MTTGTAKPKLSPSDVRAIEMVLDMAIENSCSCTSDPDFTDGTGYLYHDRSCHVHRHRADLKRVAKIIAECRQETP